MRKILNMLALLSITIATFTACGTKKHVNKLPLSEYIQQNYLELKEEFKEAHILLLNDSIKVLFPDNVFFETGSSQIYEKSYGVFERFGKLLNKYERTSVMIVGHTDNTGALSLNEKLSLERAENSKNMLVKNNVATERMHTWGMADRHPVATNATAEGRAQNRRVEFIILTDATKFKKK